VGAIQVAPVRLPLMTRARLATNFPGGFCSRMPHIGFLPMIADIAEGVGDDPRLPTPAEGALGE
jgi:hypothetical protein